MTNVLLKDGRTTTLPPILIDLDAQDYLRLPRRGFEFNKGDRRFRDQGRAIDHANETARTTGVRQIVRPDVEVLGEPMFVVQAVGS